MIETNLMRGWAGIVESVSLFALVILGLCLIARAVKPSDAVKHLGAIIGCTMLLLILPAIMMSAWSSLTSWQQIGVVVLIIFGWICVRPQRKITRKRHD